MNPIDLTNRRFGRWLVLRKDPKKRGVLQSAWTCICDCGTTKSGVLYSSLSSGTSKSCGCLRRELLQKPDSIRQQHRREYVIWQGIKTRCYNVMHPTFKNYGGRGITMCEEWEDFGTFIRDMGPAPKGGSIERIDVNGNYTPENCKWIPKPLQSRNRRSNIEVEWGGKRMLLVDVARIENVEYMLMRQYLRRHRCSLQDAVEAVRSRGHNYRERAADRNLLNTTTP